jgi:nicotinamide mononucleotide transporter
MPLMDTYHEFITEIQRTTTIEFIAVVFGIGSVYFSKRENILVYPVGMVSTSIFIFLYVKHGLFADATVNFYYTVMSIVGWVMWGRKKDGVEMLKITSSNKRDWLRAAAFFLVCYAILFFVLIKFTPSTVPRKDAFVSAAAFTGMWLMNKKKIENWFWWIVTNIASIPLNFNKHLAFTSFQYMVLLVLAVLGWIEWHKRMKQQHA